METRTRFVFLMHPKEFKEEKAATGRLTHLNLVRSEIHMGVAFDENPAVQSLIRDPRNCCVLLYPGHDALNLSAAFEPGTCPRLAPFVTLVRERQLVVFLLDATWALGRKMLRLSPGLQELPRIMFTPSTPSRYVIKQQPHAGCLSTLEATHEVLLALERLGVDRYPRPDQLLAGFDRMQEFQLRCAADPSRSGYRRRPSTPPAERIGFKGRSATRRARLFQLPTPDAVTPSPWRLPATDAG